MRLFIYPLLSICLICSAITIVAQNVGIGTDTPDRKLEVADTSDVFIRINSTDDSSAGLELFSTGGGSVADWRVRAANNGNLLFQRHPTQFSGLGQVTEAVFASDGSFKFGGGEFPNADFDFHKSGASAEMWLTASNFAGKPSYNLVSGVLGFSTRHWRMGMDGGDFVILTGDNDFASDSVEAIRVDPDGNVGIGITNPTTELHVDGEMQMATAGFSTSQKDKIAIRGILEDQAMVGLGWLKTTVEIGGVQGGNPGAGGRSALADTYEMYYKSQGAHRWFVNQNASLNTTPMMILNPDGWLGLGPDDPDSKFHITGGNGASLTGAGYMQIGNTTSSNLVFDTNEILARNNGNPSTLYFQYWAGNLSLCWNNDGRVGIGTSAPNAKVHITDGTDVNLGGGGELVLGNITSTNLAMDGNEIQARADGAAAALLLQNSGGDVLMVPGEAGQVGIGILSSSNMPSDDYLLAVDGKVICEEVRVEISGSWPDYVFRPGYALMPLNEVESHIREFGHLPGVPSANQIESDGVLLGDMQRVMMEKIEEMTLHIITLEKEVESLKAQMSNSIKCYSDTYH